jgi:hypothetical protein
MWSRLPHGPFTPRNVRRKDCALPVYAVRARVPNPDGRLKPGMPVDAWVIDTPPP